ncbi:MAG: translation initiation factor IF-1 [Candidatus Harrisonbacteria bacterium CG10_big_fil_rev_8_21_14_0_10_44_23]|uniref:Translation initiation factor IF-1 n=1 Tax=Candidatus Harrisonbacteria bacterium CG10_big_fil_rev_8_21_14_0_10_44_23 TaxID=1974585 RepID=A0A2H0US04_9BACT|nr:MAG: translation initiation factor IF-1 [Candidatus Harrisonbacteria bacterium CG10_big_fil_rev_8_21_14_0_10_44_23]
MSEKQDTKAVNQEKGIVEEALPGGVFKLKMEDGRLARGYLSGKMRKFRIKIVPGDEVLIDFSLYDREKGRITRRL